MDQHLIGVQSSSRSGAAGGSSNTSRRRDEEGGGDVAPGPGWVKLEGRYTSIMCVVTSCRSDK
jgi:hypothetical protein